MAVSSRKARRLPHTCEHIRASVLMRNLFFFYFLYFYRNKLRLNNSLELVLVKKLANYIRLELLLYVYFTQKALDITLLTYVLMLDFTLLPISRLFTLTVLSGT